ARVRPAAAPTPAVVPARRSAPHEGGHVQVPKRHATALLVAAALLAGSLTACANPAAAAPTLTYWASNQGSSRDFDKQTLQPELAKFERQTGIHVNVEVVPWSDLLAGAVK